MVASLLGLRLPRNVGYVILGADPMARHLGAALRRDDEEVVFIDTNADSARQAEEAGFKVVFGDGLDERALVKARVETRRACIGATPNESVNFLFATKVHERARNVATYVAIDSRESGVSETMVKQNRALLLFAGARELAAWRVHASRNKVSLATWRSLANAAGDAPSFEDIPEGNLLPLTLRRAGTIAPLERN